MCCSGVEGYFEFLWGDCVNDPRGYGISLGYIYLFSKGLGLFIWFT